MAHIVIDGYNLIKQVPELERHENLSLEHGRNKLIELLKDYRKQKHHKITVVFDGQSNFAEFSSSFKEAGINIHFTRTHETADDIIKKMAEKLKSQGIIVSSDRSIVDHSKRFGAATISSPKFFERLIMSQMMNEHGFEAEKESPARKPHKRWQTYKKGPRKKLPKKARQNKTKLKKL